MKKNNQTDVFIKLSILLLGIIYGLLDYFVPKTSSASDSLFKFFVVTLLIFVVQEVFSIGQKSLYSGAKPRDIELRRFVSRNRGIISSLVTRIDDELDRAIRFDGDEKFIIEHSTLAISSYLKFWELLKETQERERKPLELQITHSCQIDIWVNHPLTKSLLQRQREFCAAGGSITRILCERGANPSEATRVAATTMREYGIKVKYYNIQSEMVVNHDFAWDFARVMQTAETVIWDSFTPRPGGVIAEAVYTKHDEYKSVSLSTLWRDIEAHAIPFPF